MTCIERWADIPGYEGLYAASDHGRIKSLARINANGRRVPERALRPYAMRRGHLQVVLTKGDERVTTFVHRLVLLAFRGLPSEGQECCHNDGNPANNNLSNLRWDTRSANAQDKLRHGNNYMANKTHCKQGHPFDEANTHYGRTQRNCRACKRIAARKRRQKCVA